MLATCVLLICQYHAVFGQYQNFGGSRADMTFDDHNNRFDITDIIGEQNRMFHDLPVPYDEDGRRVLKKTEVPLAQLFGGKDKNNRRVEDFAYHDKMEGIDYEDNVKAKENYEKNLAPFQRLIDGPPQTRRSKPLKKLEALTNLYKRSNKNYDQLLQELFMTRSQTKTNKMKKTRRSQDEHQSLDQTLLNYGVPLNMKVSGYIPLV